jgi:membrane associated rhomboid family serine protease
VIPLKDYNPTRHFAYVTVLLIAVNIFVYFFVQLPVESTGESGQIDFTYRYAAVPCEIVEGRGLTTPEIRATVRGGNDEACDRSSPLSDSNARFPDKPVWLAILFSMFLHGGLLHLGGNMLFLWIFGNNIEDRMGSAGYLVFYLLSGLAAAIAHVLVQPFSTVPVVGASGAVAGVMGAYLVLFPNVPIRTLLVLFFVVLFRDIAAKWLLGLWFLLQFWTSPGSGVAWVAHVGGFAFGAIVAFLLRERLRPSRVSQPAY